MDPTKNVAATNAQVCEAGFVQRREWMLYKIREDHYPFNISVNFDFDRFERPLFEQIIQLLVSRHEVLRTTLQVIDGSLKQVIRNAGDFKVSFPFFDLRKKSAAEKASFIRTQKLIQEKMPFNFEFGPLFRILVFAKDEAEFEVTIVFHHVVFDQYSIEVFKNDAVEIWQAISRGDAGAVPVHQPQYQSYTAFENQLLDTALGDTYRQYWGRELVHGVPMLGIIEKNKQEEYRNRLVEKVKEVRKKVSELPAYDHRFIASVIRRYQFNHGGAVDYVYTNDTLQAVRAFKQTGSSSLHALFIASFLIALHKVSGQEFFGIDVPASRRKDGPHKDMIGWLAAGGICFFDINENRSTSGFLTYIDTQLYLLSKHCVYPFEALGHASEIPPGSNMPVLFSLTEINTGHTSNIPAPGVITHTHEGETSYQDVDIFLTVSNAFCSVHIGYNSAFISPAVLGELLAEQEKSLNSIVRGVAAPEKKISANSFLS